MFAIILYNIWKMTIQILKVTTKGNTHKMTLKVVPLFVGEDAGCWLLSIVLAGDLGMGLGFVAILLIDIKYR